MMRKALTGGILAAFFLFAVVVVPVTAGGKQEKAEKEKSETEQSAESTQSDQESQKEQQGKEETPISSGDSSSNSSGGNDGVAAVVEGEKISMDELNRYVQMQQMQYMQQGRQIQGAQLAELKKRTLDYLIDQEVLYQLAQEAGYEADEEKVSSQVEKYKQQSGSEEQFKKALAQQGLTEENLKEDVRKQLVLQKFIQEKFESKVSVSDQEAKDFYDENPDYFTQKEQVKAKHIIIRAEKNAGDEKVQEAKSTLQEVQEKLENGADFEELAREYSEGPSSEKGGSLGFIQQGQMVPEFEKTAFSLEEGEVSDIIRTQFGFHIVKVTEKKKEQLSPFQEVKSDIVNHLKQVKMDEKVQSYLKEKKQNMDIEREATG